MNILTTLLFFLNFSIPVPVYEYQIAEEIRYVERIGKGTIFIQAGDEQFVLDESMRKLDLENYYPIDALTISGNSFEKILFYHDEDVVAILKAKGKEKYDVDDVLFQDVNYRYRSLNREEVGGRIRKRKLLLQPVSIRNFASFVESIVFSPKTCYSNTGE